MASLANCVSELQAATQCIEANPSTCAACYQNDGTVEEALALSVEQQFRTSLAFVPPTQQGFCADANGRVCDYYATSMNCCCTDETIKFIKCAFDNVYVTKYGVTEPCRQGCGDIKGGVASDNMTTIIVIAVTVFLALLTCGGAYFRKKRISNTETEKEGEGEPNPDETEEDDIESSKRKAKKTTAKKVAAKQVTSSGKKTKQNNDCTLDISEQTQNTAQTTKTHHTDHEHSFNNEDDDLCNTADIEMGKPNRKEQLKRAKRSIEKDIAQRHKMNHMIESASESEEEDADYDNRSTDKSVELKVNLRRMEEETKLLRLEQRFSTRKLNVLADVQMETKEKLKDAEIRAQMAETDRQMTLKQQKKEKKQMSKAMKKIEKEKRAMAKRIAALEAEKSSSDGSHSRNSCNRPVSHIDVDHDFQVKDEITLASRSVFDDDDEEYDRFIGEELSRRSDHSSQYWHNKHGKQSKKHRKHHQQMHDRYLLQEEGQYEEDYHSLAARSLERRLPPERLNPHMKSMSLRNFDQRDVPLKPLKRSNSAEKLYLSRPAHSPERSVRKTKSAEKLRLSTSMHSPERGVRKSRSAEKLRLSKTEHIPERGVRKSKSSEKLRLNASDHSQQRGVRKSRSSEKLRLNHSGHTKERGVQRSSSDDRFARQTSSRQLKKMTQEFGQDEVGPIGIRPRQFLDNQDVPHRSRRHSNDKLSRSSNSNNDESLKHHRKFESKLAKMKSERLLSSRPPERKLTRTFSERGQKRDPPEVQSVKRSHSGDKLKRTDRFY